jgi:hypothetical protein
MPTRCPRPSAAQNKKVVGMVATCGIRGRDIGEAYLLERHVAYNTRLLMRRWNIFMTR